MDPSIIASGISSAASLLGGLFGGKSNQSAQDKANATNLQIAREANQNQYQMFQEQNSFNERMWNAMNEYNTPANQMQRYKDAGLNPYIAAGNVQTGNAQSAMQSAPAPVQHVPQMMPATGMGDAIQNSFSQIGGVISQFAQNELALSQAAKNRAEAGWVDRMNGAKLGNINADTLNKQGEGSLLGFDYKLKSSTLGNYIRMSDLSVANMEKTNQQLDVITHSAVLENVLKNIDIGVKSRHQEDMFVSQVSKNIAEALAAQASIRQRDRELDISQQNADSNRMNAQTNAAVGSAQIQNLIQSAIESAARTVGIHIDNDTSRKIQNYVIDTYHSDAKSAANNARVTYNTGILTGFQNDTYYTDKYFGRINDLLKSVFIGAGAYYGSRGLKGSFSKGKPIGFGTYK